MIAAHMAAIVLAVIIDRLIGDPRWLPHPVIWMGNLIGALDKRLNKGKKKRVKGYVLLVVVLSVVALAAVSLVALAYFVYYYAGIAVEAWFISTTISAKGLKQAADEVKMPLLEGDLTEARLKLSYIVGRDTEQLTEEEIIRATVETVAENTTDGVTAPLFFALLGGAPLALIYRAINTCDSMVGYKSEKYADFGFASAKCDDLVNYIPSRVTGIVMIFVTKPLLQRSRRACWKRVRQDAPTHLSPNSGWNEAAAATLLGIQLGGINTYKGVVSNRATMGERLVPLHALHIEKASRIMLSTEIGFTLLLIMIGGGIVVFT